jgi:hypothetical protein
VKGILAIWKCLEVGESFTLGKIPSLDKMEKHMYLTEPRVLFEAGVYCTLFPCENLLTF